MTKETLLMQYQSECLSALKSVANIHKPFEKAFMDTMKLFMAIPDRINFLQLGRYGCFSEQTYRNLLSMKLSIGLRSTALSSASISQAKKKSHRHRSFLYPQIGQEDTLDRLLLVWLCRRVQAWIGNHGHQCH